MTSSKLHCAVAVALLASLAVVGCKKEKPAEVTPPVAVEPAPLPPMESPPLPMAATLDVSAVTLGTEAGTDKMIATPMTTFAPTDPIVVSVATTGVASNAEVAAKLVYEDGQTAGEEKQTITTDGAEITNITFANAKAWPTGNYTVEVWINGTPAQNTSFTVR